MSLRIFPDEDDVAADPVRKDRRQNFEIPELIHNINMLMDNCEEDLISADRRLKHHRNKVDVLKVEEEKLSRLVDREKEHIGVIRGVLDVVEELEERHESGKLDLETARGSFRRLEKEYPQEYRVYELPHIASTVVAPLLKKELSGWAVLDAPFKYKAEYAEWREILFLPDSGGGEADPFYSLVWESWMPSVRSAVTQWNTRNPDVLIAFLKGWSDLVPARIMQNIRDLMVLPRLQSEVSQWDPMTDAVPLHSWLHPWLEVVGRQLDIVYPTIRQKLGAALSKWHPSDKSARLILLPWREVFDRGSMQAFLLKNIVPKLGECLAAMPIDPSNQNMESWRWFSDWSDLVSPAASAALLDKNFFPTWLKVLATWLNHSPNYGEVTTWYQGWKREFSAIPDLLQHQQVQAHLRLALEMMNNAVTGGSPMAMQPGAFESMRYLASSEAASLGPSLPAAPPPPTIPASAAPGPSSSSAYGQEQNIPQTFKDLLAKKCADRGILFVPIPNRSYEGKQVYKCGNAMIYLDRTVIFVNRGGMWLHMPLDELLAKAL